MVSMNGGAVRLVSEARRVAWLVGGVLLVVIGLVCLALPLASLLGGQPGGFGLLAIAAGLLALGLAALRGVGIVRLLGPVVALVCAGFLLLLATSPLRGLTPAPGSAPPSIDALSLLIGLVFLGCAVLLAVGLPNRRP